MNWLISVKYVLLMITTDILSLLYPLLHDSYIIKCEIAFLIVMKHSTNSTSETGYADYIGSF